MTELEPHLHELGDRLERAANADLAASSQTAVRRPRRISRRLAIAVAALVIAIPGAAIAAEQLTGSDEVAVGLPAANLWLQGTKATCNVVTEGVEFHCVLAGTPSDAISDWKGTVEPTVDASKHVNGGCRSLASDGREWQCYIGQAAVEKKIIGQQFLGEFAPGPGVG